MQRQELVIMLLIAVLSLAAGFGIFAVFFHPLSGELRPRFRGAWGRVGRWLKAHLRPLALGLALSAAVVVLLFAALRFRQQLAGLFSAPRSGAEQTRAPEPRQDQDPEPQPAAALVADHLSADWVRLDRLPTAAVEQAKRGLRILYVHASHGGQLASALKALPSFKGEQFAGLDLRTVAFADDASYPPIGVWTERLRAYLQEDRQINLVMWSWASELSSAGPEQAEAYLGALGRLEEEYPQVRFIYMTGHVDGTGLEGNLHRRNEQIRAYCREKGKTLFDFADIESYDPDGQWFGDKRVNDGCWYDGDGDGLLDRNWAREWADLHPGQWFDCNAPHSHPLSANLKAYAAWWLWARLAGWDGA